MAADDQRDPAAPLPVAPQATLPHGPPPPWMYPPPYHPPEPHVNLHKSMASMEVVKLVVTLIVAACTVGGIVWAGGALAGEFRAFEVEVRTDRAARDIREKKNDDDHAKATSETNQRLDEMNAVLQHLNITGRNRPRRPLTEP